jgi:hypothetical protein
MTRSHRSILSRLDDAVRWTGIPARVADPLFDGKHQPLRWVPLLLVAISCVQLVVCFMWPQEMERLSLATLVALMPAMVLGIGTGVVVVYMSGPLGKPSREDDEREAALRKDSLLFCLGLLAALNGLGQPILLTLSQWQNWQTGHSAMVVISALILNATLLGTLPTLYASWSFRRLPKE